MAGKAFNDRYQQYREAVEEYLQGLFAKDMPWKDLYESMRYSLLAGGKRKVVNTTFPFANGRVGHTILHKSNVCKYSTLYRYSV